MTAVSSARKTVWKAPPKQPERELPDGLYGMEPPGRSSPSAVLQVFGRAVRRDEAE